MFLAVGQVPLCSCTLIFESELKAPLVHLLRCLAVKCGVFLFFLFCSARQFVGLCGWRWFKAAVFGGLWWRRCLTIFLFLSLGQVSLCSCTLFVSFCIARTIYLCVRLFGHRTLCISFLPPSFLLDNLFEDKVGVDVGQQRFVGFGPVHRFCVLGGHPGATVFLDSSFCFGIESTAFTFQFLWCSATEGKALLSSVLLQLLVVHLSVSLTSHQICWKFLLLCLASFLC